MAKKGVWVVGNHAVNAVLSVNPERAVALWVVSNSKNSAQQQILALAQKHSIAIQTVDKRELAKLCDSEQHQGIALQARPKPEHHEQELEPFITKIIDNRPPLLLVLDQVQDPHNFGACLRTADAAGADALIVARDNAAPMTAVVQKVASGAAETMPIFRVTNLARTLDSIKQLGVWVIGTSDKADHSLYQESLTGPLALVMGAEGKGMRRLTEKKCDALINLPMAGSVVTSLNVSVATGICLYEVIRQRNSIN